MKKIVLALLVIVLVVSMSNATVLAYPNEHLFWDYWLAYDTRHLAERETSSWDDNRVLVKYKDSEDSCWYGHHKFSNLQVYFADSSQGQMSHVSFECKDGDKLLDTLNSEHGIYVYQETGHDAEHNRNHSGNGMNSGLGQDSNRRWRHQSQHGAEKTAYYWIGKDTILKVEMGATMSRQSKFGIAYRRKNTRWTKVA